MIKEITCSNCGKRYRVNLNTIRGTSAKLTCKSCGQVNYFKKETTEIEAIQADPVSTETRRFGLGNSLKIQINASIVAIVLVIMGVYAGFTYFSTKAEMERTLDQAAEITAQKLSKQIREPYWALDDDLIKESLTAEMLNPEIIAINLLERDGKTIYKGLKRSGEGVLVENMAPLDSGLTSKRMDIVRDHEMIGSVEVFFTDKYMKDEFRETMLTILIIMVVLVVAIVLLVSYIFQKMIIRPILELTTLANRISMGDLDTEINTTANNEIGSLAKAFNRLKTSIQISLQALNAQQR